MADNPSAPGGQAQHASLSPADYAAYVDERYAKSFPHLLPLFSFLHKDEPERAVPDTITIFDLSMDGTTTREEFRTVGPTSNTQALAHRLQRDSSGRLAARVVNAAWRARFDLGADFLNGHLPDGNISVHLTKGVWPHWHMTKSSIREHLEEMIQETQDRSFVRRTFSLLEVEQTVAYFFSGQRMMKSGAFLDLRPCLRAVPPSSETRTQQSGPSQTSAWNETGLESLDRHLCAMIENSFQQQTQGDRITALVVNQGWSESTPTWRHWPRKNLSMTTKRNQEELNEVADFIAQCREQLSSAIDLLQLLESRRAIDQTQSIRRLTNLAFVFVPLAYVAVMFSADIQEMDKLRTAPTWKRCDWLSHWLT
ncbi:hypothetical protein B0T22DRAFT_538530 [Podospora appendiculata]|uniref:Uncharacterized protein n=1 Tax=Podospora appendiculata TaxID=314037 RepID=A0AAE0X2I1_9PEZI|nr:hypothetical protein B0T22DRAFT_538530 [Podospora appendiculata]